MAEFRDPVVTRIAAFLTEIGIETRAGAVSEDAFLPGIAVNGGILVIDERRLAHPGDLLHEAGHIAVTPPERRPRMDDNAGQDGAEEMMAIAWSYAAALRIGIDPEIVFHEEGYRGGSQSVLENFRTGHYFAVSTLQWAGMTRDVKQARETNTPAFPHMLRWVRE